VTPYRVSDTPRPMQSRRNASDFMAGVVRGDARWISTSHLP
jgi:hypothetical protein